MIVVLFILLLLMSFVAYRQGGRHLNSPWFIVNVMFTICVGVYTVFFDLMGKDISVFTVIIVIWGLFCWGIGQRVAQQQYGKRRIQKNHPVIYCYEIPLKIVLFCTLFILGTVVYSYKYYMEIASSFGGNDFFSAYGAARMYMLSIQEGDMSVEIHKPGLLTISEMLASSIAYYFIYVYCYSKIICKEQKLILVAPIISYLPILFFATSRMAFMGIIAATIGIFMTLRYSSTSVASANKRIFKILIPIVIVGAIIFRIGGALRGGAISEEGLSDNRSNASVDLCMYVASNIYALNYFVEGDQEFDFGSKTLSGVRQILGRFGVEFKVRPRHYENVKFKVAAANVYTGFKEDIVDYTVAGYWVYLILVGYICGLFFYFGKAYCYTPHAVFFVVLGKLYYPIIMYFYTDDFYSLTGVDFLVPLFLLVLVDKYIKSRYIFKKVIPLS